MINVQREEAAMFSLRTASGFCRDNFFLWLFYPIPGHGLPLKASLIHSDAPHSAGLVWTSDQPAAGTSTRQHTQQTRHPRLWRDSNPYSQQAMGRRIRLDIHTVFWGLGVA